MSAEQLQASRAEQRKQRLLEVEMELAAEEAEALKMTEEQRQLLMQPFKAVKAEFADLDGMCWTQTALRKLQRCATQVAAQPDDVSKTNTLVVLTNADLASFSQEDTIRVPPTAHSRPSFPSPLLSQNINLPASDVPCRHRDGSRTRSPIKGLFRAGVEPVHDAIPSFTQDPSSEPVDVLDIDKTGEVGAINTAHQEVVFRGRSRTLVPPGLAPAPTYISSSIAHSMLSPSPSNPLASGTFQESASDMFPRDSPISLQRHACNLAPLPHRDAPSPPSELISLPPPSSRLDHNPIALIDPPNAFPQPPLENHQQSSPRARLHSLLQDDSRTTTRMPATKPPSRPIPRAAPGNTTPTPLELSATMISIQGSFYDDDETPHASPVDTGGRNGSPSISWIQELAA